MPFGIEGDFPARSLYPRPEIRGAVDHDTVVIALFTGAANYEAAPLWNGSSGVYVHLEAKTFVADTARIF